jgi:hypothetical protein
MLQKRQPARGWRLGLATLAIAVGLSAVFASGASSSRDAFIQTVQIGSTSYRVYDLADVLSLIPQPEVRTAMRLVRLCRASGHFGYYSGVPREIGAAAWFPSNPIDCLGSGANGGPGGPTSVCFEVYRANDTARSWVAFYGSTPRMCARMSTQVPGGALLSTTQAVRLPDGSVLSAGSRALLKCQRQDSAGLHDLVVLSWGPLPGPRSPYWFDPRSLSGGGGTFLGVPSC